MLTSNPSLCNKSLRVRIKVAHGKLFLGVARHVWRCAVTATYENRERRIQKRVSVLWKKREKPKNNFIMTFGKSLSITQSRIRCSIYVPLKTKDLAIELTMAAYRNWDKAWRFARAKYSDLLRALNHLGKPRFSNQLLIRILENMKVCVYNLFQIFPAECKYLKKSQYQKSTHKSDFRSFEVRLKINKKFLFVDWLCIIN